MKLLFLGLCLASVLGGPAHRATSSLRQGPEQETPGRRPGGPGPMAAEQLQDLNLSPDQQERVEAIFKNQRQQLDDLRSSNGPDRDKMMSSMRKLESQTDTQLKAVLTREQYAKYQAKKKDRPHPRTAKRLRATVNSNLARPGTSLGVRAASIREAGGPNNLGPTKEYFGQLSS